MLYFKEKDPPDPYISIFLHIFKNGGEKVVFIYLYMQIFSKFSIYLKMGVKKWSPDDYIQRNALIFIYGGQKSCPYIVYIAYIVVFIGFRFDSGTLHVL